jgi:putative SOS response-associated peptidase YedK
VNNLLRHHLDDLGHNKVAVIVEHQIEQEWLDASEHINLLTLLKHVEGALYNAAAVFVKA